MSTLHIPVLLNECLTALKQMPEAPLLGLDLTFGRGGHAKAFLNEFPNLKIMAVDQDQQAFADVKETFADYAKENRVEYHHVNFHNFVEYAKVNNLPQQYDYIMMDLGVSSPQLDNADRGFSFYHDGPLDMRMDQTKERTAADIVNEFDEDDLNHIFKTYGEVRNPYKVTKHIIAKRQEKRFETTLQLSTLIESLVGWHKKGVHPATQYFMAIRLFVNNELHGLKDVLPELINYLRPEGRLLVITFHSLEDRIVKQIFKSSLAGIPVNKKVIKPLREEELSNKRSRSAQLRVFQRTERTEKTNKKFEKKGDLK